MKHDWADPASVDAGWAPGRQVVWRVTQDRCRRCLIWKTEMTETTRCPGGPGGMETAMEISYALGCPRCTWWTEVSEEDPDATLWYLSDHLFSRHAGYDRKRSMELLRNVVELDEAQAAAR